MEGLPRDVVRYRALLRGCKWTDGRKLEVHRGFDDITLQRLLEREIRTLRATWRGLETAYGAAIEALPKETRSQRLGRAYGVKRLSSTLPAIAIAQIKGMI